MDELAALLRANRKTLYDAISRGEIPALDALAGGLLRDLVRSREELIAENTLLRQQLLVAARSVKKPRFTGYEGTLLVILARLVPRWRDALLVVKPDTILRWHREGFRLFWRARSRPPEVSAPRVSPETVDLIRRLADENRLWGAERIRGELLKLGIRVGDLGERRRRGGGRPGAQRSTPRLSASRVTRVATAPPTDGRSSRDRAPPPLVEGSVIRGARFSPGQGCLARCARHRCGSTETLFALAYFAVQPVTVAHASVLPPLMHDCGMHRPMGHSVLLRQSWNSPFEQVALHVAVTVVLRSPALIARQHKPPSQSAVSSQCSESLCEHDDPFALHIPVEPARFSQQ